jgi:hypothetical protein
MKVAITEVFSGNYLRYKTLDGQEEWVRVRGVICDEPGTPWGDKAKGYVEKLALNKPAMLVLVRPDENGIYDAQIFPKGKNLSQYLLRTGLCEMDAAINDRALKREVEAAKKRERGRWLPPTPEKTESASGGSKKGFTNNAFLWTMGGMGFLAIMIVVSRKRAASLKREQAQRELAEKIQKKNQERESNVVPVDLTSNVFDVPKHSPSMDTPLNPLPSKRDQTIDTIPSKTEQSEAEYIASLPEEERALLDNMTEEQRTQLLKNMLHENRH